MNFITEWVTNIILFVLLASVMDMLLPNTSFQKYTKMVAGLLLIAIILTPILKFISQDFEQALASVPSFEVTNKKNMEKLLEMKKSEIQASQDAYILEQMAVQLEKDAKEELMEQYGLEITKIDLLINEQDQLDFPENLNMVIVQLKEKEQEKEEVEAIEVVQKVEINTEESLPSLKTNVVQKENIASFLSKKWDVNEKSIEVQIEGGETDKNG